MSHKKTKKLRANLLNYQKEHKVCERERCKIHKIKVCVCVVEMNNKTVELCNKGSTRHVRYLWKSLCATRSEEGWKFLWFLFSSGLLLLLMMFCGGFSWSQEYTHTLSHSLWILFWITLVCQKISFKIFMLRVCIHFNVFHVNY